MLSVGTHGSPFLLPIHSFTLISLCMIIMREKKERMREREGTGKNRQMSPSLTATAVVTFSLRRNDGHADVDHLLPRGWRSGWNLFLLFVTTGCHYAVFRYRTLCPVVGTSPSYSRNTPPIFRNYEMHSNTLMWTRLRQQMCSLFQSH